MSIPVALEALLGGLAGWGMAALANLVADRWKAAGYCSHCGWRGRPAWPAMWRFLRWGGQCPQCSAPQSRRPFGVEIAMALTWAAVIVRWGLTATAGFVALYVTILVVVAAIDLDTRLIPNRLILPASALALILAALGAPPGLRQAVVGGAIALGFFLAVMILGQLLLRLLGVDIARTGPALGGGDVKLGLFIGLITGYPWVVQAILVGTLAGGVAAAVVIASRALRRQYRPFIPIAYGPYLAAGALFVLLFVGGAYG